MKILLLVVFFPVLVFGEQIDFYPRTHELTLSNDNGEIIVRTVAAGGKDYCPDIHRRCRTPVGTFTVGAKYGPNYRSGSFPVMCHNKAVCGARMPYFMKFAGKKFGIHGGHTPAANVSHGCIRVPQGIAKKLRDIVSIGTRVVVHEY